MIAAGGVRLFVSDVDGTLVRHDKTLPEANVAAARRLVDAGIAMSLISARPPSGMTWIARELGLDGPFAAFNGGTMFAGAGAVLSAVRLGDELAARCFALLEGRLEFWVFAKGRWFAHHGGGEHARRERLSAGLEPTVLGDFSGLAHDVDKIVCVSDDSALLDTVEREARERFESGAYIVRSQPYYLDLTAPKANKGEGIAAIAAAFGVPLEQVVVAGDMDNDLPMFARAGTAIAMGQAPERVRKAAAFVSDSNDDDGLAKAIDRLLAGTL